MSWFTMQYDTMRKYLTCSQETDGQPAQSTTRDQKLKRNNDKKIKQTDEHNSLKSSLSPRRKSSGKIPEVCEKRRS